MRMRPSTFLLAAVAIWLPRNDAGAHPSAPADDKLVLPEPCDPATLARLLREQPAQTAVLDLRPAWQFAEWSVPGARNVALDGLQAHITQLAPELKVVLVDRDGSLAFAAAGALMAKAPQRPLQALAGGLQRYYREVVLGVAPHRSMAPAAPTSPTSPTSPAPSMPKKRGAGC
jgi:rhodanese-related sulfurtransferase